jgi:hypothetical protein
MFARKGATQEATLYSSDFSQQKLHSVVSPGMLVAVSR